MYFSTKKVYFFKSKPKEFTSTIVLGVLVVLSRSEKFRNERNTNRNRIARYVQGTISSLNHTNPTPASYSISLPTDGSRPYVTSHLFDLDDNVY